MGRREILGILKDKRKYMSEKELTKISETTQSSVHKSLKRLVKSRYLEVKVKKIDINKFIKNRPVKYYRYKR